MPPRIPFVGEDVIKKPKYQVDLMLDSGAYSAWRTGETIPLDQYMQYIEDNKHLLTQYVNLDVIAGQRGRGRTSDQLEESAKKGFANYEIMCKEGFNPIHVYHAGERWYWLEKLLDSGAEYIGVGLGLLNKSKSLGVRFFDDFFSFMGRYPKVQVHGFGMTAIPLIFKYPWTSVDSASWIFFSAYGLLMIPPTNRSGGWDFSVTPEVISVSSKSGEKSSGIHIEHLGKNDRERIYEYIKSQIGRCDLDELDSDYYLRQKLNARYFKNVSENYVPVKFHSKGLFGKVGVKSNEHINIVLAFGKNATKGSVILQEAKIRSRLFSYHSVWSGSAKFDLEEYVTNGFVIQQPRKKGRKKIRKKVKA